MLQTEVNLILRAMSDFYPPHLTAWFVALCQWASPLIGRVYYRLELELEPDLMTRWQALQPNRLLLVSNHPTFQDWISIFLLSAQLKEQFYYWAAYERFQSPNGWVLQRLGAYSLKRGMGDRASIAKTLELLTQKRIRLVVFPEGGCTFQNDVVSPFRNGAVQIGFQAVNRLVRQQVQNADLYVVPLSIKYRYEGDTEAIIESTLSRLEAALTVEKADNPYNRLRKIGEKLLHQLEAHFGLHHDSLPLLPWNQRIQMLREHVLQSCEALLEISTHENEPVRERVYRIQNALSLKGHALNTEDEWNYTTIQTAIANLLNFDAIYDGYVADHPTPERFLDTLTRMERSVFKIDRPTPKCFRRVSIAIGEPINLLDWFEDYRSDRQATITLITQKLQQTVQDNLFRLSQQP